MDLQVELDRKQEEAANELIRLQEATEAITLKKKLKSDAKKAAAGKDAIVVSHQLPIWILRSAVEGRKLLHDPRKRECTLASVTGIHFDNDGMISGTSYLEPAKHLLPNK